MSGALWDDWALWIDSQCPYIKNNVFQFRKFAMTPFNALCNSFPFSDSLKRLHQTPPNTVLLLIREFSLVTVMDLESGGYSILM